MAVTKRVRFEVLRRDDHTCQYCGAKAPDVTLQIDHVMPVSLGGDDKPGNLVTACRECNSGKTSITPDSPLVEGLSDRAAAYALGMQDKMTKLRGDMEELTYFTHTFHDYWDDWTYTNGDKQGQTVPLPPDYELSLFRWMQMGIPIRMFKLAISKAMSKNDIRGEFGKFQYMAGVINGMLDSREIDLTLTAETVAVYTEREHKIKSTQMHWRGFDKGKAWARHKAVIIDPLRNHVDGTRPVQDEESGEWSVERIGAG